MKTQIFICLLAMFLVLGCVQTPADSSDTKAIIQTTNKTIIQDTDKTISDATVGKAITKFELIEDPSEVESYLIPLDDNETESTEQNETVRRLLGSHRGTRETCTETD